MNRQIARLGIGLLVGYLALFAQLNRLQFFTADSLTSHPVNSRPLVADFGAPRGSILAADGTVIAESIELEDGPFERQRVYPQGELFAEVSGAFSFNSGATGLELAFDDELRGDRNALSDGLRELLGGESETADVHLTLMPDLQRAARDALGERRGSVVALDPVSGAMLATWSWPTYDPGPLSSVDTGAAASARGLLLADERNPLLARSYQELFFPGSTFKIVTAAAALDNERATLDQPIFASVPAYTPPLTNNPLGNFGGSDCGGPLRDLIRRSCNAGMAQLGVELIGPSALVESAESFGFNTAPPLDMPGAVASTMPTNFGDRIGTVTIDEALVSQYDDAPEEVDLTDDAPSLAQAAIGQFDVKATPLQMALVAAAVANEGEVPQPHVVDRIIDSSGATIEQAETDSWRTAMSGETARALEEAMIGVVTDGTAKQVAIDGVEVGAKTGTAQLAAGVDETHAWIIAIATDPATGKSIAVAVLIEADAELGEQTGGRVAGPVAHELISVWLASP